MENKTHQYPPMLDILWTNILELKLFAYYVMALIIGFVAPIKMPFVAICFIMAVDMGTALVYVYAKESTGFWDFWQNRFLSDRMKRTVYKLILYSCLIIVLFVSEKYIFVGEELVKPGTWLLAAKEIKSIVEHIDNTLDTNLLKSATEFFKKIFRKL